MDTVLKIPDIGIQVHTASNLDLLQRYNVSERVWKKCL